MADRKDLQLCMVSGSFEYDSHDTLRIVKAHMESQAPIQATLIEYEDEDDDQSLAAMDDADVLLLFTRRLNATGAELERFQAYCRAGRPVVGLRTASHGYQNWLEFDKEILGGNYQAHHGAGPTCHVELAPEASDHPVLTGVEPYGAEGSLYINAPISADTTVLLTGQIEGAKEPILDSAQQRRARLLHVARPPAGRVQRELPPAGHERRSLGRRPPIGRQSLPVGVGAPRA